MIEFEMAFVKSKLASLAKPAVKITQYVPDRRETPTRQLDVITAWRGLETILADIIDTFHLSTDRCLEFGVEQGFSTIALSEYFKSVTGVDTFQGDRHSKNFEDNYNTALAHVAPYDNIHLVRSDYRDYIKTADRSLNYDLIHVDIIHTFEDTYACGLWGAQHSTCTIFHDTESFPQVKQAVREVARTTGKKFYNFKDYNGLGILV